ncbi:MAG: hypothetical protein UH850_14880 [Paludibacteraceae bacterium]|nr:hypothetical protein [Paludibacteraceae bacterium]
MIQFEIVAKLKAVKESEKFKGFEVKDFSSGWQNTRYRFNAITDNSRFQLEIGGGKWIDDKKNKIITMKKAEPGKKASKFEVKWEDRKKPEVIEQVAGFRIYTCNLLTFDERQALEKEGKAEDAQKKNHQFLEKTEMAALVKKVIDSGKYADAKFKILGTVDFQYSAKDNQFYRTYTVNKMYKVPNETPCKAEMTINAFYTENAIDDTMYDEKKKYLFNCYTDFYFSSIKENRFVPISLVIKGDGDDQAEKRAAGFKKKLTTFDDEATVRKIGFVADMIDGAEQVAITFNDLDDETKEDIENGLISEEDAIKALGGSMTGERVAEYRIKALAKGMNKSEATVYTEYDLHRLPVIEEEEEDVDLFADDSDDDI